MRKVIVPILIFTCLCLGGCDFVRSSLGKPTSSDIEELRQRKAAAEKAEADSIATARAEQERLAAEKAAAEKAAAERFFAVVGAFRDIANADKLAAELESKGIEVTRFDFRNGLKAVAVAGAESMDNPDLARFSPWLYDKQTDKHIKQY